MRKVDILYRSYLNYRHLTEKNSDLLKERKIFKANHSELDSLESKHYKITIDADWIKFIESKLDYIEKAIKEDRQFILTNGEVVPIEKNRRVSRASVVHLAKHSNLIKTIPQNPNDTLIPEKIYQEEKLTDYAVYENRFLYMLLVNLKEFVQLRLDKIAEISKTFETKIQMDKKISISEREINFKLTYDELNLENIEEALDETSKELFIRIEDVMVRVNSFLKTDLMIEVSKAPIIKPPLIKTNVLKMNQNFKRCVELYDFISAFNEDGFSKQEIYTRFNPFSDKVADNVLELISLTSFFGLRYGSNIEENLKAEYEKEEERIRQEKAKEHLLKLKQLKRVLQESKTSLEEYLLALEERNKFLEAQVLKLKTLVNEKDLKIQELNDSIITLKKEITSLTLQIEELTFVIKQKDEEIVKLKLEYEQAIKKLVLEYDNKLEKQKNDFEENLINLENRNKEVLQSLESECESKIKIIIESYEDRISMMKDDINNLKLTYENDMNLQTVESSKKFENLAQEFDLFKESVNQDNRSLKQKIDEITKKYNDLKKENDLASAQIHGLRYNQGLIKENEDYTSKDAFLKLEAEYDAFTKFYKAQWKKTKKRIKEDILKNKK